MRRTKRLIAFFLALVTVVSLIPLAGVSAAAMKRGSSGTEVRRMQENLQGLGFLSDTADGKFGPKTQEAVIDFQSAYGLTADGAAGEVTQTAIRNAVVRLQVELKNLGYAPGTADGHFGAKTRAAVKALQKDAGLSQTGIADKETWNAINSRCDGMKATPGLRKGSTGTQVRYMQQALIGLGFLNGTADGAYGPKTEEAVRKYQKAYGLGVDGSAGINTMTSLRNTVITLQSDLARKGYTSGKINGVFGNGTVSAVKAYQRSVGISADGVAGPNTMKKLYGYSLVSVGEDKTWKIWIKSQYQSGDKRKIKYYDDEVGRYAYTDVETSGCGGVSVAMAVNALLGEERFDGLEIMNWYVKKSYYWGHGTHRDGIRKFPLTVGLGTTTSKTLSSLISHLKQGRLAIALIKDIDGRELFVKSASGGHYILISGYRIIDGKEQVFVNNPLSYKRTGWFNTSDLMANVINLSTDPFVIIYK